MRSILAAAAIVLASATAAADTLFNNLNGIDVDASGRIRHFTGLLIDDDGTVKRQLHGELLKLRDTQVVDMGGRTVLPGMIDAHGHIMAFGQRLSSLDVEGVQSIAELQQRVAAYAAANPGDGWIVGAGWNQELWADGRFPTAADIDQVAGGRPVWLRRIDGHAALANSAAMRAAGVPAETAAPTGGRIDHGLFVDNAMELIDRHVPPLSDAERDRQFTAAQAALLADGLTSVADMWTTSDDWSTFQRAAKSSRLKLRIIGYAGGPDNWRALGGRPTGWLDADHLKLAGMKIILDGTLGSRGAWLDAPYTDQPASTGSPLVDDPTLEEEAHTAASAGGQLAIHAIGDRANHRAIELFEELSKTYGDKRRWRIEHFQIVDPSDIARLKPAGIIASMQPSHETSDWQMAEKRLGPTRLAGAYAWHSVLASGARLAFGSDFPFGDPNPFAGMAAAISRTDKDGLPPGGWQPQGRVTLEEALSAFTRGGAYAGFAEGKLGCLDPHCQADFIIVDRDPTRVDVPSLAETKVLETWIGGRRAWASGPSGATNGERGR